MLSCEIKKLTSELRFRFASNEYEKYKSDAYGIENCFSSPLRDYLYDALEFATIGIDINRMDDSCLQTIIPILGIPRNVIMTPVVVAPPPPIPPKIGVLEPIQFIVGSGKLYVPNDQDDQYNNSTLSGKTNFIPFDEGSARPLQRGRDFYYISTGGFGLLNNAKFFQGTGWTINFY